MVWLFQVVYSSLELAQQAQVLKRMLWILLRLYLIQIWSIIILRMLLIFLVQVAGQVFIKMQVLLK